MYVPYTNIYINSHHILPGNTQISQYIILYLIKDSTLCREVRIVLLILQLIFKPAVGIHFNKRNRFRNIENKSV